MNADYLKDGKIQSYPYPPASLLLVLPGYLSGDVRWCLLAAMVATAGMLAATGRRMGLPAGHPAEPKSILVDRTGSENAHCAADQTATGSAKGSASMYS